ncbi:type II toxin-antitoxin system VapC family toxin [uncultured Thiothrix sp.]|jgi:predicted nucleic acid-binding protein|uniref:type II toxin-antitoxin system VapC family toxin n=1 Tax=uncultured Thiothrix sp. TaxID=223185 RepID=UPI00260848AE|nr:type II toxin-antitoxin system VapC family toxin [uncultured Thiothrix sp.]HMT91694.1 type II toxin-antitoxin system VapC family toxin [Thiolinea sp.]
MKVVDSCGWLEYFADGKNAEHFAAAIEDTEQLLVPSISIFEVFKRTLQQSGEDAALQVVAIMAQGTVIDLDMSIALSAAKLSVEHKMPMADSIILATAQQYQARVLTQDNDFEGLTGVEYFKK